MVAITLVAAIAALWVGSAVICVLKGKWGCALLAPVAYGWVIPAMRLAKPHSWWARNRYDEAKLKRSRARFPEPGRLHIYHVVIDWPLSRCSVKTRKLV